MLQRKYPEYPPRDDYATEEEWMDECDRLDDEFEDRWMDYVESVVDRRADDAREGFDE